MTTQAASLLPSLSYQRTRSLATAICLFVCFGWIPGIQAQEEPFSPPAALLAQATDPSSAPQETSTPKKGNKGKRGNSGTQDRGHRQPAPDPGLESLETATPPPLTERQIFVPFDELADTLNNDGRGVFLPYREFLDMWEQLEIATKKPKEEPPQGATISSATFKASPAGENALDIQAELHVLALKEGWSTIDLGPLQTSISEVE